MYNVHVAAGVGLHTHTWMCGLLDSHACNGRNWRHAARHYQDQNQVKHIFQPFSSLIVPNEITVNRLKFTGSKVVVMKLGAMSSCSKASVSRLGDKYGAAVLNLFCGVPTLKTAACMSQSSILNLLLLTGGLPTPHTHPLTRGLEADQR